MLNQRDEYAASQTRGLGCGFWAIWILVTLAGGFFGQWLVQSVTALLLPESTDLLVVMLVLGPAGILGGVVIGLWQGVALLRYLKLEGLRDWVLASALGGLLRWGLVGPLSWLLFFSVNTGIHQCNYLIVAILYSILAGLAFGLPQAYAFDRHVRVAADLNKWAWSLAYVGGGLFSLPFISLSGTMDALFRAMNGVVTFDMSWRVLLVTSVVWFLTGLISGLPLVDRLRHADPPDYVEV